MVDKSNNEYFDDLKMFCHSRNGRILIFRGTQIFPENNNADSFEIQIYPDETECNPYCFKTEKYEIKKRIDGEKYPYFTIRNPEKIRFGGMNPSLGIKCNFTYHAKIIRKKK